MVVTSVEIVSMTAVGDRESIWKGDIRDNSHNTLRLKKSFKDVTPKLVK